MNRLRVAVIGAGGAGLCAARYMAARPDRFEPVVFEKTDGVGGTWVYTEETGNDKHGLPIHSSMYASLKTNLPKEVMAFPDFPFDSSLPSFVKHKDVMQYLEQYTEHFDLRKYIQFCTVVDSVRPVNANSDDKLSWEVRVKDVRNMDAEIVSSLYDAVMVCNGHYALPKYPTLEGLDSFQGQVLHSHNYRHPSIFEGKTVLLVGAGASGMDISLDMSSQAKQVYLSHWRPRIQSQLPKNVTEVQAPRRITGSRVEFTDGTEADVDAILFCSGYHYDFSFLHPDCKVDVTDGRITPLYKHLLHSGFPSLSFVGIAIRICPFPQFSAQIQFALAALDGSMKLPTREEMEQDEEEDYRQRLRDGLPHRYAHLLATKQWQYNDDLLQMAGVERHKPVVGKLYDAVSVERKTNVCTYKKMNFKLLDGENYETLLMEQ